MYFSGVSTFNFGSVAKKLCALRFRQLLAGIFRIDDQKSRRESEGTLITPTYLFKIINFGSAEFTHFVEYGW